MNDADFVAEGSLFRVGPDCSSSVVLGGIVVPNGIAFSPDDQTFYFADTRRYAIWAYDFDLESGEIWNRRVFAEFKPDGGRPDGSCIDCEGFLWNAEYAGGRVVRYAPDGRVDRVVPVPMSHPTSCCFGGAQHNLLFVTSASYALTADERAAQPLAGALLALDVGVCGLPEPRFGG
jgi:sugar lactone lactonase YvrE